MQTDRISNAISIPALVIQSGAGTGTTGWIDMGDQDAVLGVVYAETAGTSLDAKFEQATNAAGAGAKDVPDTAITQITSDEEGAKIECYAGQLDVDNSFNHIRLSFTVAGAGVASGHVVVCDEERYSPGADSAKIVEIVKNELTV